MSDLRVVVNGRAYGGWKSVQVTRSIESLAGSFELDVTDRWAGQNETWPWPILEEDECLVEIDGVPVIDGFVDRRSISLAGTSRTLSYSGRDKAAALVDCSPIGDKSSFRNLTALEFARKLAQPFGLNVSVQPGITLARPSGKLAINPGESAYQAIARIAAASGVLLVSDGARGILLCRAGSDRAATPLVEGENILAASVEYDATERFARYVVTSQVAATDEASGAATGAKAEAQDLGVVRLNRVLLIRPEQGMTTDFARQRADWEARIRAAKAESVSIVVQGWKQPIDGALWPLNQLITVRAPTIGVTEDLLISQVEHFLGEGGETTQLRLVRPDAFRPEPMKAQVKKRSGTIRELRDGA